ncbi:hypothetical protein [Nocardia sp. NPDC050793]
MPSPLHPALIAQFAANDVDAQTAPGAGQHTQLSPAMWAAVESS